MLHYQDYQDGQQQRHQHLSGSDFFADIGSCPFLLLDYVLYPIITIILCLLSVFVVFGNLLVVSAIWHENQLHSVTNYLIASLAAADCLVGAVVMPFSIISEIIVGSWRFGPVWCDLWHSFDVLASTASIMNLCAISLDRYLAITNPISYPTKMTPKRVALLILSLWTCSSLISFPAILWWRAVGSGPLQQIGSITQRISGGPSAGTGLLSGANNITNTHSNYMDTVREPGNNNYNYNDPSTSKTDQLSQRSGSVGGGGGSDSDQAQTELLYKCVFTDDTYYLLFSSIVSFYGPLCVMLYAYYCIYKAAVKQTRFLKYGSKQVMISKSSAGSASGGSGGGGPGGGGSGGGGVTGYYSKRALKKRAGQLYIDSEHSTAASTTDHQLRANGDTITINNEKSNSGSSSSKKKKKKAKLKMGSYDTNCDGVSSMESYDRQHLVLRAHRGGGGGGGTGSGSGINRSTPTHKYGKANNRVVETSTASFDKAGDGRQLRSGPSKNSAARLARAGPVSFDSNGVVGGDNQPVPVASVASSAPTRTINLDLRDDSGAVCASDSDDVMAVVADVDRASEGGVGGNGFAGVRGKGQLVYYDSDKLVQSIVDLTAIHYIDCTSQGGGGGERQQVQLQQHRKQVPSSSSSSEQAASGCEPAVARSTLAGATSGSSGAQFCDGPKSVKIDATTGQSNKSIGCARATIRNAAGGLASDIVTTCGAVSGANEPGPADTAITIAEMSISVPDGGQEHQHQQQQQRNAGKKLTKLAKERKAAKTLGIVVGVFILCWLPFFVVNIIVALCGTNCIYKPHILLSIVTWLGWLNSAMNPVIYACWSRDFRRAFRRVLCTWVEFVCYDGTRLAKKLKLKKKSSYSNGNKMYRNRASSSIKGTSSATARSAVSFEAGGGSGAGNNSNGGSGCGGGGACGGGAGIGGGGGGGSGNRGYAGGASGNFRSNNNAYTSLLSDQQQQKHNNYYRQQQQQQHRVRCDLGPARSVALKQEEEEQEDEEEDEEEDADAEEEEEEVAPCVQE